MPEQAPFKETLFSPDAVATLGRAVQRVLPEFDEASFGAGVFNDAWPELELKARLGHVTAVLHDHMATEYPAALEILLAVAGALEHGGFVALVPSDYVATYGLDDPDRSIPALGELTKTMSSEFAIRPFIVRYQDRTMRHMLDWADNDHEQVRRLATEGSRPRLPWGIGLPTFKADPSPVIPILDKLKDDPSEVVRRSVANNLNDISKDNPDVMLTVLRRWHDESHTAAVAEITKHALRTLVKAGDPRALQLLGFPANPKLAVHNVRIEPVKVVMGSSATLSFDIESTSDETQQLVVDYVVHYVKANGSRSPKVWKLRQLTLKPRATVQLRKAVSFKPVTTRRYYPGTHAVEPKINGHVHESVEFEVVGEESSQP